MHLNGGKLLKCHLKGKTCSKLANGLNFYVLKNKLSPGVIHTLPRVIYMYITILVKQVYWYTAVYLKSQVSVYGPLVLWLFNYQVIFKVIVAQNSKKKIKFL